MKDNSDALLARRALRASCSSVARAFELPCMTSGAADILQALGMRARDFHQPFAFIHAA
jgi:hypothetical protein